MRIKKKARYLTAFAALLLVAAMLAFAACGKTQNTEDGHGIVSLTLSGQDTSFAYGEAFSSAGLTVTAHYDDGSQDTLSDDEFTVDSSQYQRTVPGNYTIEVSADGTDVKTSYTVTVREREILPAPTTENKIYVYDEMDPEWSERTINYEIQTGQDLDWEGRYSVSVYAPGDEIHMQDVGMVAAYSQMHGQQLGLSTIGMFDFNGEAVVRVTADFAFEQVDIRPLSLGIEWERVAGMDNTIEFTLTRPCNISVEFDGNTCTNLMLFTDEIREYSMESEDFIESVRSSVSEEENLIIAEPGTVNVNDIYQQYSSAKHNVIVFGKGIYFLTEGEGSYAGQAEFEIPSDTTVYIHGDAGIYGFLRVTDATNVTIEGRGYVSGQMTGQVNILLITNSKNVVAEGFVMYHSNNWTNVVTESQDVTYRSIRIAGQRRNNNDGFDICNSSDILVDNCWIRTIDDCVTIKGRFGKEDTRMYIENIVVQNTTLWNYQGGNGIVVGSESCTDVYNNIIFRNIDIIHNNVNRAIAMEILDSARVTNVIFDDIRMELTNTYSSNEGTYAYGSDYENTAKLISLELISNEDAFYGTDTYDGTISDVVFNNITYNGNPDRKIEFKGTSEDHQISNVIFNNFSYNGTVLNDYNASNYFTEGCAYYSDIRFTEGEYYFAPDDAEQVVDDTAMQFEGAQPVYMEKEGMEGGGYSDFSVRLGDAVTAKVDVLADGYSLPVINFKVGETGGLFDVAFDGVYSGTVNTYSATSQYMEYYLPMQFIAAGEHIITFTARSTPNINFEGWMLGLCIDYVSFMEMGSNYIEFEMLKGASRVEDSAASGGYAAELSLSQGQTAEFTGVITRARGAQLILTYLAGPDKGIYKFYYNGILISPDIDMYSPVSEYRTYAMGTVDLKEGQYTITAKCIGKNEVSTGTGARLDCAKTLHLSVSKTYKGGFEGVYNGVVVSSGIEKQSNMMQPIKFSNIRKDGTIAFPNMAVPIDGTYEYRLTLENFDATAFEIYWQGEKLDYVYSDGIVTFRVARLLGVSDSFTFLCVGDGTYAFNFVKAEIVPYDVDKSELSALVAQEDERDCSACEQYIAQNFAQALDAAKKVLFSRASDEAEVQRAIESLKTAASRIGEGAARYNEGILTGTEVTVSFADASRGDLAILYLNCGSESESYFALVGEDGNAVFLLGDTYVGKTVKLYSEVVGDPLAGAQINVGDKIVSALDFLFDDTYWKAEQTEAYYFGSLRESDTITVCFETGSVRDGDLAMLSLRNLLNEEIGVYYSVIEGNLAKFTITGLDEKAVNLYAVVRTAMGGASVTEVRAEGVLLGSADVGKSLAASVSETDGVTVSSGLRPDADGYIRYPANCGWKSGSVEIGFPQGFDRVEIDLSILGLCGSGGRDAVYIYSKNKTKQLDMLLGSTDGTGQIVQGTFSYTYDECGGGLVLDLWYGCVGDWSQCKTHGEEYISLGAVRFYGSTVGQREDMRMIGGSIEIPDTVKVFAGTPFRSLYGAREIKAYGEFESGKIYTAVIKDSQNTTVGEYYALCEENGLAIFSIGQFLQEGAVTMYCMSEAGNVAIDSATADIEETFHLGKAMYASSGAGIWTVRKGTASLTIGEDGCIRTDTENIYRQNYWIGGEKRPLNGYDYYIDCADLESVERISIAYTFRKICNCGGGDWFWIINGGEIVGQFSCQDKALGTYSGTIVIEGETLAKCTSSTFSIFYGMGCSERVEAHAGEVLEFGEMSVKRTERGDGQLFAIAGEENMPAYTEKEALKGYSVQLPYGKASEIVASTDAADGTSVTLDIYREGTKIQSYEAKAEGGELRYDVTETDLDNVFDCVFSSAVKDVSVLMQVSIDMGEKLYENMQGMVTDLYGLTISGVPTVDSAGRFTVTNRYSGGIVFTLGYQGVQGEIVSITQEIEISKYCNCGGDDGVFYLIEGHSNIAASWEQPGTAGTYGTREITTTFTADDLSGASAIRYQVYLGCVYNDPTHYEEEYVDFGALTMITSFETSECTVFI